tara:strand:+ start:390 stop:560 length:171 start_codon:yes stop_codon:yes gene_type:complete
LNLLKINKLNQDDDGSDEKEKTPIKKSSASSRASSFSSSKEVLSRDEKLKKFEGLG